MIRHIGIIGNGRFGKVLEKIVPKIFKESNVVMFDRTSDLSDISECDLVIPAVQTKNFEDVILHISPHLKQNSIVMDICSVKIFPVKIMQQYLPKYVSIIGSHPMFGSGTLSKMQNSLQGLTLVIDPVKINESDLKSFIENCEHVGLKIVTLSADEHDQYAAQFHFTAQFVASILKTLKLKKTPIDTKSVAFLHEFSEIVQSDSIQLLEDMYKFNPYCKGQLALLNKTITDITSTITK